MRSRLVFLPFALLLACAVEEIPGTQVIFDLHADLSTERGFWRQPWPLDTRLLDGAPDARGFPQPEGVRAVPQALSIMGHRKGFSLNQAGYFRFNGPLKGRSHEEVIAASPKGPLLLVDLVDGSLHPVVATVLDEDEYSPRNFLGVAPVPGVILRPARAYAYVVLRSLGDAEGKALGSPLLVRQLLYGESDEAALSKLFEPLASALKKAGVDVDEVAAATVFTTGDLVGDVYALTEKVRERYSVELVDLKVREGGVGPDHPDFCELVAQVDFPQFQEGTPPFDQGGTIQFGADGVPAEQRKERARVTLSLPKGQMPASGHPLMLYFHGSGGSSKEGVDSGPKETPDGPYTPGLGPASVVAPKGIAMVAPSLPLSADRTPGLNAFAYLNFNNFASFPGVFLQGTFEQRLLLDALLDLEIPQSALEGCSGVTLPEGATGHRYDPEKIVAMGLSMGGMYTNIVSAVEPRIKAVAPTGAGGYWSFFLMETELLPGALLFSGLIKSQAELSFLHPVLQLVQTAWEWAEPLVYLPSLARRPLPGHPVRPIYQPVGEEDSYFTEPILDALSLAYGVQQAGEVFWPELQTTLAHEGNEGLTEYPLANNRVSETGVPYTAGVVQWDFDGFNGHHIVFQREGVKHQYGCFFSSWLKTGTATLVAPGAPCPGD